MRCDAMRSACMGDAMRCDVPPAYAAPACSERRCYTNECGATHTLHPPTHSHAHNRAAAPAPLEAGARHDHALPRIVADALASRSSRKRPQVTASHRASHIHLSSLVLVIVMLMAASAVGAHCALAKPLQEVVLVHGLQLAGGCFAHDGGLQQRYEVRPLLPLVLGLDQLHLALGRQHLHHARVPHARVLLEVQRHQVPHLGRRVWQLVQRADARHGAADAAEKGHGLGMGQLGRRPRHCVAQW
mmetsp:Transcript_87465/g.243582  ORF Transcript_87465/g.243582 Transcript_87465/m.243582 type:complete len:244 (-) Transcript_87465:110-841(-)